MKLQATRNIKAGRIFCVLLLFSLSFLTPSCKFTKGEENIANGDTIVLSHAKNLSLVNYPDYTLASLRDPWQKDHTLHQYILIDKTDKTSEEIKAAKESAGNSFPKATIVLTPLSNAAVFTAVHCALMQDLGVEGAIAGVADAEYIFLPFVKEGLSKNSIADLGNSMQPNIERIMTLMPEAVFASPFQNSGGYGRLEKTGIPIIECADYMEVSPLARAEWMKFYGRLFGTAEKADKMFADIEAEYNKLKGIATKAEHHPTLLAERLTGSVWHVPGGESTMGIMYKDAGANYLWGDTPESGSLQKSMEHVIERAMNADIWLFKYTQETEMDYNDLAEENAIYTHFKAFKEHNIYACNTLPTLYYEETPFHPERLLANLLQIIHPELSVSTKNTYFCPLKGN